MKKVLVILFDNVEEVEALAPIDMLRRANVETTVASLGGKSVIGRSGVLLGVDANFNDVKDVDYAAIVLPGGIGVKGFLEDTEMLEYLKVNADRGVLMAAICAAPAVFEKAGIINEKKCTSHPSVANMLKNYTAAEAVVVDGNILTSQGAGTAVQFGLEIVAKVCGDSVACDIAKSICFER